MACPVCGIVGPGDPAVGIMEDDGICPECALMDETANDPDAYDEFEREQEAD